MYGAIFYVVPVHVGPDTFILTPHVSFERYSGCLYVVYTLLCIEGLNFHLFGCNKILMRLFTASQVFRICSTSLISQADNRVDTW